LNRRRLLVDRLGRNGLYRRRGNRSSGRVGRRRSVGAKRLGRFLAYDPSEDIVYLAIHVAQYPVAL
jgi:hypothetical protein